MIDLTADLQTLVNWARNPALSLADRISALSATLSSASSFGWLRAELNSPDLLPIFVAAGATVPALSASIPPPPDPHNDTTFAGVVGIQGLLQIAKDKSAITAQRLAAIAELQNNLSLISPSEFPNLNTAAAGAGRGYDNSEISAQLTLLQNLIKSGQG